MSQNAQRKKDVGAALGWLEFGINPFLFQNDEPPDVLAWSPTDQPVNFSRCIKAKIPRKMEGSSLNVRRITPVASSESSLPGTSAHWAIRGRI